MEQNGQHFDFHVHGARGTTPSCGPEFAQFGGHTSCFSLESKKGILIFDAGTGLVELGRKLVTREELPPITILLTHFHLDHVMGLPSFAPLYDKRARITFVADARVDPAWPHRLAEVAGKPYWPVDLKDAAADLSFVNMPGVGEALEVAGMEIMSCRLHHPQSAVAYRVETSHGALVVATDHEPGDAALDEGLIAFAAGSRLFLSDAQYTPEEFSGHRGWGHGTWSDAVAFAREAGVEHLLLTHHAPHRTDEELTGLLEQARHAFPGTEAAHEGYSFSL